MLFRALFFFVENQKKSSLDGTIHHGSNPANISGRLRKHRWKRLSSTTDSITNHTTSIPPTIRIIEQTTATIALTRTRLEQKKVDA